MADTFDAGRIEASLDVDRDPFTEGLRVARAQADEFERRQVTAKVDADTSHADAKLMAFRARQDGDDINIPVEVDTAKADAELAATRTAASSAAGRGGFGGLLAAGVALGPALIPVLATLTAGTGAFALGLTAAGTGVGAFALIAVPSFKHIGEAQKQITAAQKEYTAAVTDKGRAVALAKEKAAWDSLTPAEQKASKALDSVEEKFHEIQKALAPVVLGALVPWLGAAKEGLGFLPGLVTPAAAAIKGLGQDVKTALGSPFWKGFFDFLGKEAGPAITTFGHVLGDLAHGFAGILMAFAPMAHDVERGVVRLSAAFARWGEHLGESSSFQHFVDYVRENGPLVGHVLMDLGGAFVAVLRALAPLGPPLLAFVDTIAKLVTEHPQLAAFVVEGWALSRMAGGLANKIPGASGALGGLVQLLVANPEVGGIVLAIAAVSGGLFALWHNSDTAKVDILNLFVDLEPVIKTFAQVWLTQIGYTLEGIGALLTGMRSMLTVFLGVTGAILTAAAIGFGWIPGIGGKLRGAARDFDGFKHDTLRALGDTGTGIYNLGRAVLNQRRPIGDALDKLRGKAQLLSDTIQYGHWIILVQVKTTGGGGAGHGTAPPGSVFAPGGSLNPGGTRRAGRSTGHALVDGITDGVNERVPRLAVTVGNVGRTMDLTLRRSLEIESPSKVGVRAGASVPDGIAVGLKSRKRQIEASIAALGGQLTAALSKLSNVKQAAASLGQSLFSGLTGGADLGGLTVTGPKHYAPIVDPITGETVWGSGYTDPARRGQTAGYLHGFAEKLRRFIRLLNKGRRMGLVAGLLDMIAQLGPGQGIPLLIDIEADGRAGVRSIDRDYRAVYGPHGYARQYATAQVGREFRGEIRLDKTQIKDLRADLHELRHELKGLRKDIASHPAKTGAHVGHAVKGTGNSGHHKGRGRVPG